MEKRKSHESLVPRWVRTFARLDEFRMDHYVEIKKPLWTVFGIEVLIAGIISFFLISILGSGAAYFLQSFDLWSSSAWIMHYAVWFYLAPMLLPPALLLMRALAHRWLRKTWNKITGQDGLDRFQHVTLERTREEMRRTLHSIARHVHCCRYKDWHFHMVRDIAALHGLCDPNLRIRDLHPERPYAV